MGGRGRRGIGRVGSAVASRATEEPKTLAPSNPPPSGASLMKSANTSKNALLAKSLKKQADKPAVPRFGASEAEIYAYEKAHTEWLEAKAKQEEPKQKHKDDVDRIPKGVKRAQHSKGWDFSHHRL